MTPKRIAARLSALLLTCGLLAGCGAGAGGGQVASGGTGGTGIVQGPVSGFGSVIVNGVHFDVSQASLSSDGGTIGEEDLRVGMVVRVRGQIASDGTSGTAVSLEYDDDLKGPVASVDVANNQFVVLGQTVLVNATTVFSGVSLETLTAGQIVEVSGFFDADGKVRASYVEVESSPDEFELRGIVSALDTDAGTFQLGAQVVSYTDEVLRDFPASGIADGQWVEVKTATTYSGGGIDATEVEYEGSGVGGENGERVELEGYITQFDSASDFVVNSQPVRTTAGTVYDDGASAAMLGLNLRIEVRGQLDADGILVAERIELENDSNVEVEASVDEVDSANRTITLLGLAVRTTAETQFEDKSDVGERFFNLGEVRAGDWLEIDGYVSADGEFIATRVERDEADDEVRLRGPVSDIVSPDFELFDVAVHTEAGTQTEPGTQFEDRADAPISQAQFFGLIDDGDIVKVSGTWSGSAIMADEAELED